MPTGRCHVILQLSRPLVLLHAFIYQPFTKVGRGFRVRRAAQRHFTNTHFWPEPLQVPERSGKGFVLQLACKCSDWSQFSDLKKACCTWSELKETSGFSEKDAFVPRILQLLFLEFGSEANPWVRSVLPLCSGHSCKQIPRKSVTHKPGNAVSWTNCSVKCL